MHPRRSIRCARLSVIEQLIFERGRLPGSSKCFDSQLFPRVPILHVLSQVYPQMPPLKTTVAIDFGTTRSAWAYTVEGQADDDIMVRIPDAAGDSGSSEYKTPTAVLIGDGGKGDLIAYGRAAQERLVEEEESGNEHNAALFRWFKLGLCQRANSSSVHNRIKGTGPADVAQPFRLPSTGCTNVDGLTTKSTKGTKAPLLGVMAAALRYFKDDVLKFLTGRAGYEVEAKDINWVLTVPAIYDDFAKCFMRHAAREAGIIDKVNSNKLKLCLEPEAACLAVACNRIDHQLVSEEAKGRQIMILDCGGGTVDITMHTINSVNPLKLTEAKAPTGGTWGATYVDKAFQDWLKLFLGKEIFTAITTSGRLMSIMTVWDNRKAEFEGEGLVRLNLAELSNQDITAAEIEVLYRALACLMLSLAPCHLSSLQEFFLASLRMLCVRAK